MAKKNIVTYISVLGSIASIVALILYFSSSNKANSQLTVFVTDQNGNVIIENEGELNIPLGNTSLNALIGENGRTNFAEIPENLIDTEIKIGLKAAGYQLVDSSKFTFTGEPITLKIKRDNSLSTISGVVKDRSGNIRIKNAKVFVNNDTSIVTNKDGIFKIILPTNMAVKSKSNSYLISVTHPNYVSQEKYYKPMTTPLQFRLDKVN